MPDDDQPIGRVLTRREALAIFGGVGAAVMAVAYAPAVLAQDVSPGPSAAAASASVTTVGSSPVPSCIVRPAETEGPYFVDEMLDRSDIRSDPVTGTVKSGTPLRLGFLVSRIDGSRCTLYPGAAIDVWHCNAEGVYSDVSDPGFDTHGQKFLRGYQVTDSNGYAEFSTIYPGWYDGRTVHIHFKVRTGTGAGSGFEFTSQLYFDDTLSDQVFTQTPYVTKGVRTIRNEQDGIYSGSGGDLLLLDVVPEGEGYGTTFSIGLQLA